MSYFQNVLWLLSILIVMLLFSLQTVALSDLSRSCDRKEPILVAVVDTGADLVHSELKNWLWTNPGESGIDSFGRDKSKNGIDDDGNGFVDDIHGWNFVKNNADVSDSHGHGTHVTGLITKFWPYLIRAEDCPPIQIMILKYFDQRFMETDSLENSINAFRYAINNNAKIINFSGGGAKKSITEEKILKLSLKKKVLFVAAAGNESSNADQFKFYPAGYNLPNILSVAALDKKNKILSSSNYGSKTVKIATYGEELLSSLPGNLYGLMSGTSQATALTTGIAALVQYRNPWLSEPQELIEFLVKTSDKNNFLISKIKNNSQLNIQKSVYSYDRYVSSFGSKIEDIGHRSEKEFLVSFP